MSFYGVYGPYGYGVMGSWGKVCDVAKYLGGMKCKKFATLAEAKEWARESFQDNVCIAGEHPRHGRLYLTDEYDVNTVQFAKNLKLRKAVIYHGVD